MAVVEAAPRTRLRAQAPAWSPIEQQSPQLGAWEQQECPEQPLASESQEQEELLALLRAHAVVGLGEIIKEDRAFQSHEDSMTRKVRDLASKYTEVASKTEEMHQMEESIRATAELCRDICARGVGAPLLSGEMDTVLNDGDRGTSTEKEAVAEETADMPLNPWEDMTEVEDHNFIAKDDQRNRWIHGSEVKSDAVCDEWSQWPGVGAPLLSGELDTVLNDGDRGTSTEKQAVAEETADMPLNPWEDMTEVEDHSFIAKDDQRNRWIHGSEASADLGGWQGQQLCQGRRHEWNTDDWNAESGWAEAKWTAGTGTDQWADNSAWMADPWYTGHDPWEMHLKEGAGVAPQRRIAGKGPFGSAGGVGQAGRSTALAESNPWLNFQ